jgi:transposase
MATIARCAGQPATSRAALRPRPGSMVRSRTLLALREFGRRAQFLEDQLGRLDALIVPLVTARAPGLLSLFGVGPDTAAMLLIAAGDNPGRLRSEAAWAHLCASAPIPASSGKTQNRHRLNRGGDRQANHAVWRIVITRMGSHPPTRVYAARRAKEGLSKPEIIRCLKRYGALPLSQTLLGVTYQEPALVAQPCLVRNPANPRRHPSTTIAKQAQ